MRHAEVLLPLSLTFGGAVIMWDAHATLTYFEYERGAPGPGFMPFWLSLGLIVLGSALTIKAITGRHLSLASDIEWPDRDGWKRILFLMGLLMVTLLVLNSVGFLLVSILYVFCIAHQLEMRSLRVLTLSSLAAGGMIYFVFAICLHVPLPKGFLGF